MIQSVQRAAQILAVLGSGTPRLGVTEIADRVGLAKPTVHGLLRTLEAHDLVAQDPDTGKYSLGPGVLQLGNAYLDGSELRARSLRWAESLAQRAGEAVWVATLSGSRVIVLHHVFRPDNTVQILEVGAAIPWHACALGHAIVAFASEGQRARALAAEPLATVAKLRTERDGLVAWLRQRGLSVADSDANFVLFGEFESRRAVWQGLLDRGVLVREVGPPRWLRVTVGTPEEMAAFKSALDEVLS